MTPPVVTLEDRRIALAEGESVLDALDREGIATLSSCRSGICQSCLLKATEGTVPARAQQGLKDSLKAQGYFLSCVCVPTDDLKISLPGEGLDHHTEVLSSEDIGGGVRRLRLAPPEGFRWFAGQYVTLIRADGVARSYSLASSPADDYLEIHVRRIPGGTISNWLHDEVGTGTPFRFRGPHGDCFYTPGDPTAPLLLAGTGTGLAPLYGILLDSIRHGHQGRIQLFHGAVEEGGLYLVEEIRKLAPRANLEYRPCVLRNGGVMDGVEVGALDDLVLGQEIELEGTRAYLCGDPDLVARLRKKLFLKGLSNRRIFADPFVPAPSPPKSAR